MRRLSLICILAICCVASDTPYQNHYRRVTNYAIRADATTPHGVQVDTSGFEVNLERIDYIFDFVEQCLADNFPKIAPFCEDVKNQCQGDTGWRCYDFLIGCENYERIKDGIDRRAIKVKVAPDWHYSCNHEYAIFSCNIPDDGCLAKGLTPTPECPCSCRSTIQGSDLITTPELIALSGELVRLVTGFNNPWTVEPLKACPNF